jgi:hypothetical protein
MSRTTWRQPVKIADAISGAFLGLGLDNRYRQSEIWSVWPAVVGPQIARHAQPHAISHGRLIVHVTDPVWLHHLSMMRPKVIVALNEKLRTSTVRELILRVGEVAGPCTTSQASLPLSQEPPPDPARVAWVEAMLAPLSDAPFLEALQRLLLRAYRPADQSAPPGKSATLRCSQTTEYDVPTEVKDF